MSGIQDLLQICPPPDYDMKEVSHRIYGVSSEDLREDRLALQSMYGGGCFNDFLWIYSPGHSNANLNAAARTESLHQVLKRRAARSIRDRLLQLEYSLTDTRSWGGTDNGDLCCWVGADSDRPAVGFIIDCKEDAYYEFEGSTTALIYRLLTGKENCPIFPDDFCDEDPTYDRPGML